MFPTSARSTSNPSTTFKPTATISMRGRTITPATTVSVQTTSFLLKTLSFMFTTTLPNMPLSSLAPSTTASSSSAPPQTTTSKISTEPVATLPGSTTSSTVTSYMLTSSVVTPSTPTVIKNSATDDVVFSTTTPAEPNSSTAL